MAALRQLVERHYELTARGDLEADMELFAPDVETIFPGAPPQLGREAFRAIQSSFKKAFPDARAAVVSATESGDMIAVEGKYTGTHTGPLAGATGEVPATGRRIELSYSDFFRVKESRFVYHRVYFDQFDLMGQLGLMPGRG